MEYFQDIIKGRESMHILFIADQYDTGGAADALLEMVRLLKARSDIKITVLTGHKDELGHRLKKENIDYVFCGYRQFVFSKQSIGKWKYIHKIFRLLYILLYHIDNVKAIKVLRDNIDMRDIDIIHSNVNRNDFGAIISKKYNIPHIWHLRESPTGHFELGFNRKNPSTYMNRYTTKYIAISEFVKQTWIQFGLDKSKITVIYDGVNMDDIKTKSEAISNQKIKIVCVGDIRATKGQYIIIDALKYMFTETEIELDFWGQGEESYIDKLKNQTSLPKNIIVNFKGYSKSIRSNLFKYDIGINPSQNEGFGRTTIEYMAAGLCVFVLNSGGNKELVNNGITGYCFNNSKELASLLEMYIKDHRKCREIAEAGKQWAHNNMDMNGNVTKFIKLYNDLLSKP